MNFVLKCVFVATFSIIALIPAIGKDLSVAVGEKIYVTTIRSSCEGGPAPDISWINSRLTKPLKHGQLKVGTQFLKSANARYSKKCSGKKLWMRKLYYHGKSQGKELINVRFPDSGIISWTIRVK